MDNNNQKRVFVSSQKFCVICNRFQQDEFFTQTELKRKTVLGKCRICRAKEYAHEKAILREAQKSMYRPMHINFRPINDVEKIDLEII